MTSNLTEGERKVLGLAWHCFETPPKVDYKKLSTLGNYKNAASATAVFLAAKKKLMAGGAPDGNAASTAQQQQRKQGGKAGAGGRKRKNAAEKDMGMDGDDEEGMGDGVVGKKTAAPTKRAAKKVKVKADPKKEVEEEEEEDDDDDMPDPLREDSAGPAVNDHDIEPADADVRLGNVLKEGEEDGNGEDTKAGLVKPEPAATEGEEVGEGLLAGIYGYAEGGGDGEPS